MESTISILRGLKSRYEVHHGVVISDGALVTGKPSMAIRRCISDHPAAAVYSARYISDRYLPDKAIDLVDEAASALRLAQESKPDELQALDRAIMTLEIELESLKKESDVFSVERRKKVENDLKEKREDSERLSTLWQAGMMLHVSMSDVRSNASIKNVIDCDKSRTSSNSWRMPNTVWRLLNVRANMNGRPNCDILQYQICNDSFLKMKAGTLKILKAPFPCCTTESPLVISQGLLLKPLGYLCKTY